MCGVTNIQSLLNIIQVQELQKRQRAFVILRRSAREQRQHTHALGNSTAEYFTCTQQVKTQTESVNFKDRENFKVGEIGFLSRRRSPC